MRRLVLISALVLAACGSDAASPVATAPTPTTTTSTSTSVPATSTTAATLSRDALLAVERCRAALGPLFAEQVALDASYITAAQDACDEAKIQLDVEDPTVAHPLAVAVATINVHLAFAALDVAGGTFDAAKQQKLQTDIDADMELLGG